MTAWLVHSFGKFAIVAWYGLLTDIPDGWAVCNGANGTPDLRDRFITGSGDSYAQEARGGEVSHAHVLDTDGHQHNYTGGNDIQCGMGKLGRTAPAYDSMITDEGESQPPFRSLYYIMRIIP